MHAGPNVEGWREAHRRGIAGDMCDRIVRTRPVPPRLARAIFAPSDAPVSPLTRMQREVLFLRSHGWPRPNIASALGVSEWTIETHETHARQKLRAATMARAVAVAIRTGLI